MLLELMREFGTDPERTLMIGDTTHDLQLAANAGTASVAVSYGAHERDAFDGHTPLAIARLDGRALHDRLARHA
jgi:phosphoglycolate phosphatase